jgi:hypothetical protein
MEEKAQLISKILTEIQANEEFIENMSLVDRINLSEKALSDYKVKADVILTRTNFREAVNDFDTKTLKLVLRYIESKPFYKA